MRATAGEPVILGSYLTLAGDVSPEVQPGSQVSPHDISVRIEAASAAGVDYDVLRRIPADRIVSVELIDGARLPFRGDLIQDSIDHRRPAGRGDFDVDRFLAAIFATGYRGPIGDENISIENRARSLAEAAVTNHDAVFHAIHRVGPALVPH